MSVVIGIALAQAQDNQTTVGGFVSFVTAMLMLLAPLKHLADINGALQQGLAAAARVFELIDRAPEPDEGSRTIERAAGSCASSGSASAIRAPTAPRCTTSTSRSGPASWWPSWAARGRAKTTLINLVPRFFSPTSGRILLDDLPIETLTLASLRSQIALVSQDVVLFDDTVRANVAFGLTRPVSDDQIRAALAAAALERTVDAMPGGWTRRSATAARGCPAASASGWRWRARCSRTRPILLLDEATSALDSETEALVQQALERTMAHRTTLVVAHRLSTIERADRIVVMEHGRIVEQGRHAELLAAGGAYARLHAAQFRG
jgi:subfamily B ATP-binding cassette protein MsbA